MISIVVPVYNVEKYLNQCVESIVNQSYSDLEIILVDDGSKDDSGRLCDFWAKRDTRVQVIHKENGGLSSARNAGLAVAESVYFISLFIENLAIQSDFVKNLISNLM